MADNTRGQAKDDSESPKAEKDDRTRTANATDPVEDRGASEGRDSAFMETIGDIFAGRSDDDDEGDHSDA